MQKDDAKHIFTKIIFPIIIVSITIILIISGCVSANANYDKTITDSVGREVNIPSKVSKIASVGSAARIAAYAGCAEKLIAVTEMEKEDVSRPYTVAFKNLFEALPTTSNGNHLNSTTVDEEKLVSLKPDIIISTRSADECNKLQENTKIPVVCVYSDDTLFGDGIKKAIKVCGDACNTSENAQNTVEYIEKCEKDLKSRCSSIAYPTIYRGAINYKGTKGITGTISNYAVYNTIGAKNVADREDIKQGYDTTLEQILAWNPQTIFIDCTNANKVNDDYSKNQEAFKQISAVQTDNVHQVGPYNMNGTNFEYGICEAYYTAKTLSGESGPFKDVDLNKKFSEIYTNLLGSDISMKLTNKGLVFGKFPLH